MKIKIPSTIYRCHWCRVQVYSKHNPRPVREPHRPGCPLRK